MKVLPTTAVKTNAFDHVYVALYTQVI